MLALRRPQCVCFRGAANTRPGCRLIALTTPTRAHWQPRAFGGADQATGRHLPFLDIPLSHRQACDAVAGIAQSHLLAPTRRQDKIVKGRSHVPAGLDRAISYLPSGMCCVLNWRSFPPIRLPHSPSRLLCFPEPLTEFV